MKLRSFVWAIAALALLTAGPASAQTALSSTTLAAALTDSVGRSVSLTSATGVTAPGAGATQVRLLIDREVMTVLSLNGTIAGVSRGSDGTRATPHVSGASVLIAPPNAIVSYIPTGACTRANLVYVPYVVGGSPGLGAEVGSLYDCLGVGAAGQWVQTNGTGGLPVLGSTVASPAGVMTATGTIFTVSGTNAVTGITVPAGASPGFSISIVPSAIFTWTAAGNISLAGSAVVNKLLVFTWNGTKWIPSYIA